MWARWPWSDLVDAIWPNGRFLDDELAPTGQSSEPIGVELSESLSGLARIGAEDGFVRPRAGTPERNLPRGRSGARRPVLATAPRRRSWSSSSSPTIRLTGWRANPRHCYCRAGGPMICFPQSSRCASITPSARSMARYLCRWAMSATAPPITSCGQTAPSMLKARASSPRRSGTRAPRRRAVA